MKYLLLYNPIAGRGRAAAVAGSIAAMLRRTGHEVVDGRSEFAGHARELAREHGSAVDRVLVLGGDGSLRDAAWGLLGLSGDERPDLGVLAFGSGNVVARELGVSLDPERAAASLDDLAPERWDVGWVSADAATEEEPFLAMLGIGYDASIAESVGAARASRALGGWYRRHADSLYAAIGTLGMFRSSGPRFRAWVDGDACEPPAVSAVLSNARTYAKGMAMSPSADPTDGRLDLHLRASGRPWVTGAALVAASRRAAAPPWAASSRVGTVFRFESLHPGSADAPATPLRWQLDGDPRPRAGRLDVRVEPRALSLLTASVGGPAGS